MITAGKKTNSETSVVGFYCDRGQKKSAQVITSKGEQCHSLLHNLQESNKVGFVKGDHCTCERSINHLEIKQFSWPNVFQNLKKPAFVFLKMNTEVFHLFLMP